MAFSITNPKNAIDAKKAAINAAKASAASAAGKDTTALAQFIPPGKCSDRIRIVFDDSGSMGGYVKDAKKGVVEFLRNCIPNQTSVAVHFMNTTAWDTALNSNLLELAASIEEVSLSSGGTPFFRTIKQALTDSPTLTRLVVFTDGAPTDSVHGGEYNEFGSWTASANVIIKLAKELSPDVPIDTVYFGADNEWNQLELKLLKYLAAETGGYFLHFDPQKVNFATAFKYLAPTNRLQLASSSFRAEVESGVR